MAKFFVDRPIVAIVISILMVLLGVVAMVQLPISLYPNIAPPEIVVQATYVGADALTIEESVATPIEAQMTGVDNMLYMYSTSTTSGGQMSLRVVFDVSTDPSTDQVLAQMRYSQAAAQLPQPVTTQGVTVKQSSASPLALFALYSPKGTHDPLFVSNYAYININDPMTRVPGVGQVQISGAGQYAMRLWVRPDTLAKLEITANDVISAIQAQNTANASGQIGGNPAPPGPAVHLHGARAGAARDAGGVRRDRGAGAARRLGGAGEGRGPRRARRPDLQHARAGSTAAPPPSSPSTSSPAPTRSPR